MIVTKSRRPTTRYLRGPTTATPVTVGYALVGFAAVGFAAVGFAAVGATQVGLAVTVSHNVFTGPGEGQVAPGSAAAPVQSHHDQPAEPPLKIMSFNVRYGTANDGEDHWDHRREMMVRTIRRDLPDIIGTQETLQFQADYLVEQMPEYEYVGWSRETDPLRGEQCGILYRRDRFEKRDAVQFWLSENPDQPASRSWDAALPRIATWIRLVDRQAGDRELLVLNTHFDHRGSEARLESAKLIRRWLEEHAADTPVIFTGDFNCAIDSEPYRVLLDPDGTPRLVDTYLEVRGEPAEDEPPRREGTFHGFTGRDTGPRIDWILHSEHFATTAAEIDRYQEDGRYPSDHFPVTAALRWRE